MLSVIQSLFFFRSATTRGLWFDPIPLWISYSMESTWNVYIQLVIDSIICTQRQALQENQVLFSFGDSNVLSFHRGCSTVPSHSRNTGDYTCNGFIDCPFQMIRKHMAPHPAGHQQRVCEGALDYKGALRRVEPTACPQFFRSMSFASFLMWIVRT